MAVRGFRTSRKLFWGAVRRNWQALLLLLFWEFPKQLVSDRVVGGTNAYIDKHGAGAIAFIGKAALFILQTPFLDCRSGPCWNPAARVRGESHGRDGRAIDPHRDRTSRSLHRSHHHAGQQNIGAVHGAVLSVTGSVQMVTTYGNLGGVMVLCESKPVDARFESGWTDALGRINSGEIITDSRQDRYPSERPELYTCGLRTARFLRSFCEGCRVWCVSVGRCVFVFCKLRVINGKSLSRRNGTHASV